MTDGLSPADRDRIAHLEAHLSALAEDVTELKRDLKEATKEWRDLMMEFRLALQAQASSAKIAVTRPMDRLSGIKLALVGLGSIVIFFVTAVGGVLGIIAFFRH